MGGDVDYIAGPVGPVGWGSGSNGGMWCDGPWLRDDAGRRLVLRGINLAGSSKLPATPDGATDRGDGFYAYREARFFDRPFPVAEAAEHFGRLKRLGLEFIRLVVTWEALEGRGPGVYDDAYLDYLARILDVADDHGLRVLIDLHQDAWSRWTGGDGAPAWTLEAVGFELRALHPSGAAFLYQECDGPYPAMLWPTNRSKLAAATLFTLFFGGDVFAPGWRVDGEPVQAFLQRHYLRAVARLADRIGGHPAVVGFGVMNEPTPGWIGRRSLRSLKEEPMLIGPMPTPLQSLALGDGISRRVDVWTLGPLGFRRTGRRVLNPDGRRAWQISRTCPWRERGIWDLRRDRPVLLRPDAFRTVQGRPVHFSRDFLRPFFTAFGQSVRSAAPSALLFLEGMPGGEHPRWDRSLPAVVHSPHWYDGLTLLAKRYRPWLIADWETSRPIVGRTAVRRSIRRQLRRQGWASADPVRPVPTVVSEFGLPFDLNHGEAYRTGDYAAHIRALSSYYDGLDANLLSAVLWNYTPDNTHRRGDGWNGEDLSIYSRDGGTDPVHPDAGVRALDGFCRPYPRATAGTPLAFQYDATSRAFRYRFQPDPEVRAPTEIVLPLPIYPAAPAVKVSGGAADWEPGLLRVNAAEGVSEVVVVCGYTTP